MKYNPVIFSVLKSQWALHPRIAMQYGEYVSELLNRNTFDGERSPINILIAGHEGIKPLSLSAESDGDPYMSKNLFDHAPKGSVAIIPIKGEMMKDDSLSHYGTQSVANVLRLASDHENITGAIIDIDSGGGAVDSVAPMVDSINYAKSKMPVIAVADLAASAAYWIATAADKIYSSNSISAEFGSIGVMVSFADVRPRWEKEGVKFHTIYAPESDYKNKAFELALKGEYEMIKTEWLSPLARKFQSEVRKNRNGKLDLTVEGILRGKTFYAADALKAGLIDKIATMEVAVSEIIKTSKK